MKITVFTSNQPRHLSLIRNLSKVCDQLFAVQECNTVFPGVIKDFYSKSDVMENYFAQVLFSSTTATIGTLTVTGDSIHVSSTLATGNVEHSIQCIHPTTSIQRRIDTSHIQYNPSTGVMSFLKLYGLLHH